MMVGLWKKCSKCSVFFSFKLSGKNPDAKGCVSGIEIQMELPLSEANVL
jgi:hypothetical protein